MRIVEQYKNICEEFADTMAEKNKVAIQEKCTSLAFKTLGALTMIFGAQILIGAVIALPTSGLSLIAITCGLAVTILGYDLAEIGHTIRENQDKPFKQIGKGFLNGIKNIWDMGPRKGLDYTANAFNAQNTILISKFLRIAVYLRAQ